MPPKFNPVIRNIEIILGLFIQQPTFIFLSFHNLPLNALHTETQKATSITMFRGISSHFSYMSTASTPFAVTRQLRI